MKIGVSASAINGFSLIEVLAAIFVLGIAVSGFIFLALQTNEDVYQAAHRVQARIIAEDAIERIKSNPLAWPGPFVNASTSNKYVNCSVSTPCTSPTDMALQDFNEITMLAKTQLPNGSLRIKEQCSSTTNLPCVIVAWQSTDPTPEACSADVIAEVSESRCVLLSFAPGY